ncbi:DUF2510 domain-containing protein [Mycolicibacterium arabiense]|nr:DUF2510 domain-containing protein [Mycolicibacterium arabiense]
MTVQAAWYSDPWGTAESRWWDGIRWTGWTHKPAIPPPTNQKSCQRFRQARQLCRSVFNDA